MYTTTSYFVCVCRLSINLISINIITSVRKCEFECVEFTLSSYLKVKEELYGTHTFNKIIKSPHKFQRSFRSWKVMRFIL